MRAASSRFWKYGAINFFRAQKATLDNMAAEPACEQEKRERETALPLSFLQATALVDKGGKVGPSKCLCCVACVFSETNATANTNKKKPGCPG